MDRALQCRWCRRRIRAEKAERKLYEGRCTFTHMPTFTGTFGRSAPAMDGQEQAALQGKHIICYARRLPPL